MLGIFCRPETLTDALKREGIYSDILQGGIDFFSVNRTRFVFEGILKSGMPEQEKLNKLLENGFVDNREYSLLERDISTEKTLPKIISDVFSVGPIGLREAVYAFCENPLVVEAFEERCSNIGVYEDKKVLHDLFNEGLMSPFDYNIILKNIGELENEQIIS